MLYIALVLSVILLLLANIIVRRTERPFWPMVLTGLGFAFGPNCLMFYLPPVALQALLLVIAVLAWRIFRRRPSFFVPLSCAATVAAYAIMGWWVLRDLAELREEFPCVSMEERLPLPRPHAGENLSADAAVQLKSMEEFVEVEAKSIKWSGQFRVVQLRQLHDDTFTTFVNSSGFGVTRMRSLSKSFLSQGLREETTVQQPGLSAAAQRSPGELDVLLPSLDEPSLRPVFSSLHEDGVIDFVNPGGFGYIKDRQHVAGFQPHQFSRMPPSAGVWRVRTLDLVGLLLHEKPVVYVSENLPRMDELREVPTRPLDAFEEAGLEALHGGEDLFICDTAAGVKRMLGPLRSTKQCVACHGGERGDLLGAFSYTLERGR
jgi:hypothetical protein